MVPKDIEQVVMLTGDGQYIAISDFSHITIEEFIKSKVPYECVTMEGYEPAFYIQPPKTIVELDKFVGIFHPCLDFYYWWTSLYGMIEWRHK